MKRCLLAVLGLLGLGCGGAVGREHPRPETSLARPFTNRVEVRYARNFDVTYGDGHAVLRVRAPLQSWTNARESAVREDVVVLVPRGQADAERPPSIRHLPVIEVPVRTIALNAEADEAFLRVVGASDAIVAVGGLMSYDDALHQRVVRGEVAQVGYTWHQAPNLEVLIARRPDLLITRLVNLDHADTLVRIRAVGVPVVAAFSWAEQTYLGQAEWVKFYGLLTGREDAANRHFDALVSRIAALKRRALAEAARPSVMWAYYGGNQRWIVYHGGIEGDFLHDAGARDALAALDLPWRDGGTAVSGERLLALGTDAEHWIIGDAHGVLDGGGIALPPRRYLESFAAWRERRLYHNYKRRKPERNAFDWYESHAVRPDDVLADLVALLHPSVLPDRTLFFFDRFRPPES